MDAIWWVLSIGLMLLGIAGIILPLLPSMPLVFAGMLILAWQQDFQTVSVYTVIALGVMAIIASLLDYLAGALGAKAAGASKQAVWGATAGALLGILAGPFGLIFGPLIGAATGEFYASRQLWQSGKVGLASWIGMILGAIAKIAIVFAMLGVFWLAYWI
ncbi:DUF456 family protein [Chitinibacter bivalviorum]|uniref:DUF456 family protein n=1 Tax=Chitinibacter bivalviorum TaxID=2739434 RepID=A0A7H9BKD8_9NEIS|nr:DUF456 family protein [Chitinibacter bivalviorum]QLG88728.1 DUF456 family protein [Chitinibacter bivalviorum]